QAAGAARRGLPLHDQVRPGDLRGRPAHRRPPRRPGPRRPRSSDPEGSRGVGAAPFGLTLPAHRGGLSMRRLIAGLFAAIVGVCVAHAQTTPAANPALDAYAKPQRLVKLADGRAIHLYCQGRGTPTVILTA